MAGEEAGLINIYVCRECGGHTITKNRDEGTTPFMIGCRATEGCKGAAESSFYRVSQKLEPMILWIKPTPAELDAYLMEHGDKGPHVAAEITKHVAMGGLLDVMAPDWQKRQVEPQGENYPTPDLQLEGQYPRVNRIVADIRGGFATTGGQRPCFDRLVDVEAVVRFVLLRSDIKVRLTLAAIDEWLGNRDGLMIEDVIEWRKLLADAIGAGDRP